MKNKRAEGFDGATPEMYKELRKSRVCVKTIRDGFERVIERGGETEGWREYRMMMLPKIREPTVSDLRPIALMHVAYKIFMEIIKEKIEHHIEENGTRREEQGGFTRGGEILDNLLVLPLLRELMRQVYRRKEELVIIAVDFSKAYDINKEREVN